MQGDASVLIKIGQLECAFIPADGRFGHTLIEKTLGQPGISLHDQGKGMATLDRLAHLLQFSDGFIQQAHLAEGNAQVVMGFGIFVGGSCILFEFVLQLTEHARQVYPWTGIELRGCFRSSRYQGPNRCGLWGKSWSRG